MNIFIAMSTIIQQLHTAIQAKKDDIVEYIVVKNGISENPIKIMNDPIVRDYIMVCNNVNTVKHALKGSPVENTIKVTVKQCSVGNTEVVKLLLNFVFVGTQIRCMDHHYQNELFFRTACENGHLETAQTIAKIATLDIHILDNDAFRQACANNHLNVSRWIYYKCPETISIRTLTECYIIAKQRNNKDIIEWLLTLYKPVVTNVYEIFNMETQAIENNISQPNIIIPRRKVLNKNNANKNIVVRITKFCRPPKNRREYILYSIIEILIFILILMIIVVSCLVSSIILYYIFG